MKAVVWLPVVALLLAPLTAAVAAGAPRPNFIVINIDDMGYADIGPFGSTINRTPNLDRMATQGRRLTAFYAAPVCSPSRAALMTGCYPKRALPIPGVLFPGNDVGLAPSEITVAEVLKSAGYATAIVGKWHLGDQPEFLPTRQGFDLHFGLPYSNDMGPGEDGVKSDLGRPLPQAKGKGQPPLPLLRNNTVVKRVMPDDQQALVELYTNEALDFITTNKDKPFFLYLAHNAVHFPIYPGKKWAGRSPHGIYSDWVEEVDWSVGQVFDALRKNGLAEKTLVIFTSDNGGTPRAVNRPLRGFKGSTWEGGMRVPTIAWWPGRLPAGTSTDAICGMFDVLPTLAVLAGAKVPGDRKIDGADIWPQLSGQPGARPAHEVFYYYRGLELEAVRDTEWKLVLPAPPAKAAAKVAGKAAGKVAGKAKAKAKAIAKQAGSPQLFNLKTDIGETTDVAAEHPEVVARLEKLVATMKDDLGVRGPGPGSRPLGRVVNPQPILDYDGKPRAGMAPLLRPERGAGPSTREAVGPPPGVRPSTAERPNILFLFADDQRADTIAAHGNPHIKTPNLDTLVSAGFSFRGNYIFGGNSGAVCVPSRAMLMSGKTWFHVDTATLKGAKLLPEILGENGYVTFGTGKWHNGQPSWLRAFQRGKNVFFGGMSDHTKVPVQDLGPDGKLTAVRTGEKFSSELFADAAIEFLRSHDGKKPFFLYVAFTAPHDPRMPPLPYREAYYRNLPPLPANFLPQLPFDNGMMKGGRDENLAPWPRTEAVIRDQLAEYYGSITHMDEQIGRVLDALKQTGHADNTLIIYAADNGLALGSHGLLGKQSVFEHSMRVPLIVAGPGIPQGKSTSAFTYLLDVYPTLCDVTGIEPPHGLEGESLRPLWEGRRERLRDSVFLPYIQIQRAVRDDRWKLICYPKIGHVQLFDLQSDPDEKTNLIDRPESAEHVRRLLNLMRQWQAKVGDTLELPTKNKPPERIDLTGRNREPDEWQPEWIRKKYFDGPESR